MSATLSIRLPEETKKQIEELSTISHRKKSDILVGWINEKLELEKWQIEKTYKAIEEADKGNFASDGEVAEFFKKWAS
jgi:predicted transcriptional regulator